MRWPRRARLPAGVRRVADLDAGERVLAFATTTAGETVLATTARLVLASPSQVRWARPWSRVDTAVWDHEDESLRLAWLDEPDAVLPLVPGTGPRLPEVVRERVEWSVVATRRAEAGARGGARLVVRRGPRGLFLQIVPDPGTRLDDPPVAAELERVRRELADEVGVPLVEGEMPP